MPEKNQSSNVSSQQIAPAKDTLLKSDSTLKSIKKPFRFQDNDTVVEKPLDTVEVQNLPLTGPNIFKGHELQIKSPNARPVNDFVSDWFTITLIVLVGFFTWFRIFYYRIFKQLISAYFNLTATNQIVRDESVLLQRASLIISIISYLLIGLFLYQLSIHFGWQVTLLQKGLIRFVLLSVAVALAYSLKMISLRMLSVVFKQERPVALYIFNVFLMVMMTGLILLPVNVLIAYAPSYIREIVIVISIGLISIMFLYRILRAIGIWIGIPGFSFFYLFLYLCGFEIAPILIIWKMSMMQ
jgi:hypothetical protein